jgi:PAS domain S-box-containing protein
LLCEIVCDTLAWDRAIISLQDDETMISRLVAFQGYPPEVAEQITSLLPTLFGDKRGKLEEYQVSHSYRISDPLFTLLLDEGKWGAEPWQSPYLLLVPLEAGGRILGTLLPAGLQDQKLPTRRRIEHLELFAAQAAIAIESIRLAKLAHMWADAVRHSGDAIVITDIDGKILNINPAFEALTGYCLAEAIGQTPRILKSNLTAPSTYDEMWHTILAGKSWRGEVINRRKDGSIYDADLTIAPILDTEEEIIGFIGSQRDISRFKELDRLKTKFVSNVSHELRTPLTNIKLYQRYLRKNRRPELHDHFFDTLDRETNRLGQIIKNLLDLSRLEASTTTLKTVLLDLNSVVKEIVAQYRAQAKENDLTLICELADKPSWVMANQAQIIQAIVNLLTNALSYTPAGGSIHVATHSTASEVAVSIRDTGCGISQEEMEQIFDRFYRGEASRKMETSGTGLGLAIVKQIVDLHRGRLQVESEVGHGSTFTLSLPAQNADS